MTTASHGVNSGVWVARVDKDLLVFFVPTVHDIPVEGDVSVDFYRSGSALNLRRYLVDREVVPRVPVVFPDVFRVRRIDNYFAVVYCSDAFMDRFDSGSVCE